MARKNKKNKNTINNNPNIASQNSLTAEEMKNIIVEAMLEVEKRKSQDEIAKQEKEFEERKEILGIKDYIGDDKIRFRRVKQFFNVFYVFFKLSFIPKKKIKGNWATIVLLKFFLKMFFNIAMFGFTVFSILLLLYIPLQYFVDSISTLSLLECVSNISLASLLFIFSRLFRVASVEIDNIDDRNYLFGVFASITSIVSIIIAVVSII